MEEEHQLKIESLRDPRAHCTCGRWSYAATSGDRDTCEDVREAVIAQFEFHRANMDYEQRRRRERAEQFAQPWGEGKQLP